MDLIIQVGTILFLLLLGLTCGTIAEKRHLRSLAKREREFAGMLVTDLKTFPGGVDTGARVSIVIAQTVIATDYMKTFLASIRKILGGEVKSYLTLLDRARREATLRVMEEAHRLGCDAVCNLRLDTSTLSGMTRKGIAMVSLFASGTAYRRPRSERP